MIFADTLYATPNALAPAYARFRVAERLLLTGHSHQAWPDCALEGQIQAFEDAARFVDDKWDVSKTSEWRGSGFHRRHDNPALPILSQKARFWRCSVDASAASRAPDELRTTQAFTADSRSAITLRQRSR